MPFVEKRELYNNYNVISDKLNKLPEKENDQKTEIERIEYMVEMLSESRKDTTG